MEFNPDFTYMLQSATAEGDVYHYGHHFYCISVCQAQTIYIVRIPTARCSSF
jgi:hypothetical protein